MLTYVVLGLTTGLSAGVSPGPLLTLVVAASLRSGLAGGLRVALAPFISDLPIVALAVFLVGQLPASALRWVGTAGGLVVLWIGVEILRSARKADLPAETGAGGDPHRELWRGALVNIANPHPYLFWLTVGGPALVRGWAESPWHALAFVAPFYALLVGSKMAVAWLVSRQRGRLSLTGYRRVLALCGVAMLGMAGWLIWQAWGSG